MADHAAPHNDSRKWLVIGVVVSLLAACLVGFGTKFVFEWFYPPEEYEDIVGIFGGFLSLFLGLCAGALLFFPGLGKLAVGETGYFMLLGDPEPLRDIHLGPGFLWRIPLLMSLEIHSNQALDTETGDQESSTGDGLPTRWSAKSTYKIANLELYQANIAEAGVPNYVDGVLVEAMRKIITLLSVSEDPNFDLAKMTSEQAAKLARDTAKFKTEVKNNGKEIQDLANKKLEPVGLHLGTVQITKIDMSELLEKRLQEIADEALQSATLSKDAENKKAQVKIYNEVFKENGVDLSELARTNPDLAAELLSQNLDRAAANEGKATIIRHNFSGRPPRGTFINTGEK